VPLIVAFLYITHGDTPAGGSTGPRCRVIPQNLLLAFELTALPRGIHIVLADVFDAPASIPHIREINIPYGEFLVTTLSVH
jgi:hypothetical protein